MIDVDETDIMEVGKIVEAIRPLLAGKGAHIQGAVIADLVAIYLAAHAPFIREQTLALLLKTIDGLIGINEKIMFPDGKHPFTQAYGDDDETHRSA